MIWLNDKAKGELTDSEQKRRIAGMLAIGGTGAALGLAGVNAKLLRAARKQMAGRTSKEAIDVLMDGAGVKGKVEIINMNSPNYVPKAKMVGVPQTQGSSHVNVSPEMFAHELGHASGDFGNNGLLHKLTQGARVKMLDWAHKTGASPYNPADAQGRILGAGSLVGGLVGTVATGGNPIGGAVGGAIGAGLTQVPTLVDEGLASIHAMKNLKRAGLLKEGMGQNLARAFGTYGSAAGVAVGQGAALGGAGAIAASNIRDQLARSRDEEE